MRKFLGVLNGNQADTAMVGELALRVPSPVADVPSVNIEPGKLKQWLDNLPRANLGEMSRQIYQAIIGVNRNPGNRQKLRPAIDLLEDQVSYITTSLEKHYLGKPLPLTGKLQKISQLVERLYSELAISYKLNVTEQLANAKRIDQRELVSDIVRIMHYLNKVLVNSYTTYTDYPAGIWQELHAIYRYAEDNKLSDTEITLPYTGNTTTVSREYTRNCLLVLACPYQLHYGEISLLNENIHHYTNKIHLHHLDRIKHPYPFVINATTDIPPVFAEFTESRPGLRLYGIDTVELVASMKKRLEASLQQDKRDSIDNIPHDLYLRLMMHWGASRKRHFPRTRKDGIVNVAIGLSAAHYFLNGEDTLSASAGKHQENPFAATARNDARAEDIHAHFTSTDLTMANDENVDVWHRLYTVSPDMHSPGKAVTFNAQQNNNPFHQLHKLKVHDISAAGFLLYCDQNCDIKARIGDLVLLDEADSTDNPQWSLATIRRMQYRDNLLQIGVEMLTPAAIPVTIQVVTDNRNKSGDLCALLLPEVTSLDQPASLVVPSLPYRSEQKISIIENDSSTLVQLTDLMENTGNYCHYRFAILSTDSAHARKSDSATEPVDFHSLWTSI